MILIDTSAWVEFLRGTGSATCQAVHDLLGGDIAICDPVRMEVLAGARDDQHLNDLRRLLARAGVVTTTPADYETAASLYRTCRRQGETVRRLVDCLIAAAAIEGDGKRFLNMVHLDDLVEAIILALELVGRRGIYNITDDEPVTQLNFFKWLSETTGRPMPPFVPESNPSTRKPRITNKRVSNKLIKKTFGLLHNYPTFREGFTQELDRLANGKTRQPLSP